MKKIFVYKKYAVIAAICLVASVMLFVVANFIYSSLVYPKKQSVDYNTLIREGNKEEEKYVEFTIKHEPVMCATYGEKDKKWQADKYYFLYGEKDDEVCIAKLSQKTIDEIKKLDPEKLSYTVRGYTFSIPEELKSVIMTETYVSESEFDEILGYTYLDDSKTKYYYILMVMRVVAFVLAMSVISCLVVSIRSYLAYKKFKKKVEFNAVESELEKVGTDKYKKYLVYITEHYFISSNFSNPCIANVSDIAWIYITNGSGYAANSNRLTVFLKNGDEINTAMVNKKYSEQLSGIIEEIKTKNPDVLYGYSFENLQQYGKIKNHQSMSEN